MWLPDNKKPSEQFRALKLNIQREKETESFYNPLIEEIDESSGVLGLMPCATGSLVL